MTPHKTESCRAAIEMLLEYDIIEPSKSPWARGFVIPIKKGATYVLLRLSLLERSDNKRSVPDTANRREPLETWRRQVLHHIGPAEEGQRKDRIRM